MRDESSLMLIFAAILICIGLCGGTLSERSAYQQDTYECTIKCPNMAHSISINQVCYCEVK